MKEPLLYKIVRPPLKALFTLVFRPTVEGKENIPADGKIILAGNHTSVFDCFTVAMSTKRCVHFIAKAELMNGIGKYIFPGLGIIPVDRSTNGKQAVVTAEEYINLGKFYPTCGYVDEIIYLYLAKGLSFGEQQLDEDEFLNIEKIPLEKAVEMVLNNEIPDGKTQAAILKTYLKVK